MVEWFVGPIMDKTINTCSDYLEEQVGWQTDMKKELERLRENHTKIQAIVFAANQAQISDQNPALNKWIWQLRDAIDEADDVLDELEYMKHKEQLTKNTEETKKRKFTSSLFKIPHKILKIGERVLKRDPNLKRLEEAVQKLDKVSADVTTFLHLFDSTKQEPKEQEVDFYKTRETGYLPKNGLISRGKEKEIVMNWLRNPSYEYQTSMYGNISLLCIVGHGDMLECLKKERRRLKTLAALHDSLEEEVMSKKFLLVLDDIWEEDEEKDKRKWEDVLAPLASGGFGSKILVTTRTDSVALMFAKVIKKEEEIVKIEGLEEDECLQLLNSYAFAGVENPNDHEKLIFIARDIVKKLSRSSLAAKLIGGIPNSLDLDERRWRTVLESNLLGQNSIDSSLRLSYIVLSNPLKNCFAFYSMFAQGYKFDKDDLIRMWIALGFIQPSLDQGETMEDIGGRYFDVLVKKSFFDKFEYNTEWMKGVNLISNLEKIELGFCCEWETLPPFGQLPFLKFLKLLFMPKVKCFQFFGNDKYRVFLMLEVLRIEGLEELENWFESGVAAEDGCLFPCLIELEQWLNQTSIDHMLHSVSTSGIKESGTLEKFGLAPEGIQQEKMAGELLDKATF
ncbi:hypothetical protein M5K25_026484 [Dendrobium thyrsiflorum]|uniref:Uncharacterized protein n=1 Tax=Dendrobium thyrsiflorum TaxID=117978 RepID=A0ABD0TXD3_DENTH